MATRKVEKTFKCLDDCLPSGCPSHKMEILFCTITNSATVFVDGEFLFFGDVNLINTLADCLQEIKR